MIGYIFYIKNKNNIKYKIGKRYKFTKIFINYWRNNQNKTRFARH